MRPVNQSFARQVRLRRLYRNSAQRLLIVPMDHSVTDGPIAGDRGLDHLVGQLARNGADAVVLHKGSLRYIDPDWFARTSLILHLSASTRHAPDPDAKYLVASVEEAMRIGADAVSVHVNLGSMEERRQVADMAAIADACDRWNMPLLAMIYPRGPRIKNPRDPELVAHAATLAADLGADIVKTPYTGTVAEMTDVVRRSPIPIVVAGGSPLADISAILSYVDQIMRTGAAGVAMGRNVFGTANPGATAGRIADLIHADIVSAPVRELERLDATVS
jgi:2-amino-4,5-dihydroxy-6-oxo-7-(phosphonooxy)heptanoate synthase